MIRTNLLRAILLAASAIIWAGTASAAPMMSGSAVATELKLVENVKIICEENGNCYRPPGRRPTARFIYGDGAFYSPSYGPYTGPGNYGRPYRRYGLTLFGFAL